MITDFGTATFPAWTPSPELLRERDDCDALLELMSDDLCYADALQELRRRDGTKG